MNIMNTEKHGKTYTNWCKVSRAKKIIYTKTTIGKKSTQQIKTNVVKLQSIHLAPNKIREDIYNLYSFIFKMKGLFQMGSKVPASLDLCMTVSCFLKTTVIKVFSFIIPLITYSTFFLIRKESLILKKTKRIYSFWLPSSSPHIYKIWCS